MATRATTTITMSMREADRLKVVQAVMDRMVREDTAVARIDVTPRQLERLLIRYKEQGPAGLTSRKRGKPSNHQLPAGLAEHAMEMVRERYSDFGRFRCSKPHRLRSAMTEGPKKMMIESLRRVLQRLHYPGCTTTTSIVLTRPSPRSLQLLDSASMGTTS